MKVDLDFSKALGLLDMAWWVVINLADLVQNHPEQVTAASCLYLAMTRFLTWFRKRP